MCTSAHRHHSQPEPNASEHRRPIKDMHKTNKTLRAYKRTAYLLSTDSKAFKGSEQMFLNRLWQSFRETLILGQEDNVRVLRYKDMGYSKWNSLILDEKWMLRGRKKHVIDNRSNWHGVLCTDKCKDGMHWVKEVIVLLSHPLFCCHHSNMPGGDTREPASLTKTTEKGSRDWKRENTGKKERQRGNEWSWEWQ